MQVEVKIINAFSIDQTGGNPAGVVLEADHLSASQKQAVATKLGFPETAFVSHSTQADFKLDFFTPTKQIPHCGHATIATFTYLKQIGKVPAIQSSKETIDGNRDIVYKGPYAFMEQKAPIFSVPQKEIPLILESLGITAEDVKPGLTPTIVNTGNSFLIVPLKSEGALSSLQPNLDLIKDVSAVYNLIGYYVYAPAAGATVEATTRMFGPYYGIEEEAATGMAAGPLACFLYQRENIKKTEMLIEQGRFMTTPSPSLIYVHLETANEQIIQLFVGGDAFVSGEKTVVI